MRHAILSRAFLTALVLAAAIPSLPGAAPAAPEVTETFQGRLQVLAVDRIGPDGRWRGELHYSLGTPGGEVLAIEDPAAVRHLPPGSPLRVEGVRRDDSLSPRRITPSGAEAVLEPMETAASTLGPQRTLVALFDFPDAPGYAGALGQAREAVAADPLSADAFVREVSLTTAWIQADPLLDFLDWHTLPRSSDDPVYRSLTMMHLTADSVAAIDPEVDFSRYDRLVFFYSTVPGNDFAAGRGTISTWGIATDEGVRSLSVTWAYGISASLVNHELGHNFGFWHASAVVCPGTDARLPVSLIDPVATCYDDSIVFEEYGDLDDSMGSSWHRQHFSSIAKSRAGWITPAQTREVTSSETLWLDQVELPSPGLKALFLPVGYDPGGIPAVYWLEYRQPVGLFDQDSSVQVRFSQNQTFLTVTPDPGERGEWGHPGTTRFADDVFGPYSAAREGSPFTDPYRGVAVEILQREGSGDSSRAQVRISRSGVALVPEGTLAFGGVTAGRSLSRTLSVFNFSGRAVTFGAAALGGRHATEFALAAGEDRCSGAMVPDGGSCTVRVDFSPRFVAADASRGEVERFAHLLLPGDDPIRPSAAVSLHGKALYRALAAGTPNPVDFGTVDLGASAELTVTVTNEGNLDLLIDSATRWGSEHLEFVDDACTGFPVAPGDHCAFTLRFTPRLAVEYTDDEVTLYYGGGPYPRALTLPVRGTGRMTRHRLTVVNENPSLGVVRSHPYNMWDPPDGKIVCGGDESRCSALYDFDYYFEQMHLVAYPAEGQRFVGWSGDCEGTWEHCRLKPTLDRSVTARFQRIPGEMHGLSFYKSGECSGRLTSADGRIDIGPDEWPEGWHEPTMYEEGTVVTLSVDPLPGCSWSWYQPFSCQDVHGPCTFTVTGSEAILVKFAPKLALLTPTGGETFRSGRKTTLRWSAPTGASRFDLDYSLDGGRRWTSIARKVSGTSRRWQVPSPTGNKGACKVRVTAYDGGGRSLGTASSPPFAIEVVKLLAPDGGETLVIGQKSVVRWRVNRTAATLRSQVLSWSADNGRHWKTVGQPGPTARSFAWLVPPGVSDGTPALVKVLLKDARGRGLGTDRSDASCVLAAADLELTSPRGGETWILGRPVDITWKYAGTTDGRVAIDLLQGETVVWGIAADAPGSGGTGTFRWTIPADLPPAANYRVRVTAMDRPSLADASGGPFTVDVVPLLFVRSPNGGENLPLGVARTIAWSFAGNPGSAVRVQLLRDGAPVRTLAAAAPRGTDGSGAFAWTVPADLARGGGYRIRLTGTDGEALSDESDGDFSLGLADSLSLAILGLGDSIRVTDRERVTIQGLAGCDLGLQRVDWANETTGASGTATGTTDWSASILLAAGDNLLRFTARGGDGVSTAVRTTVLTYHPLLSFTSALTLSRDLVWVGETSTLAASVGLPSAVAALGPAVTLHRTDEEGLPLDEEGAMRDDGLAPDQTAGDGIYALGWEVSPAEEERLCWRAEVVLSGTAFRSETVCLTAGAHLTDRMVTDAVGVADDAALLFEGLVAGGAGREEAALAAAEELRGDPRVAAAGGKGGGLWWVTADGILGAHSVFLPDEKGGLSFESAPGLPSPGTPEGERTATSYPRAYLADRSRYSPRAAYPEPRYMDEVRSRKAILISPFQYQFGANDDYWGPWKTIKDQQYCVIHPAKEVRDSVAGSHNVTTETFKGLGDYGVIDISTHGDNYYNGLLSSWNPHWGKKEVVGYLESSLSLVVLLSGQRLPAKPDGSFDTTGFEEEIKLGRLAVGKWGSVSMLPSFFAAHLSQLPQSLVILSACRSTYNTSMAGVWLAKGAGAVVGYTDYVKASYAKNTLTTIVQQLFLEKTVKEGFDEAVKLHGTNDNDADPAYLTLIGNHSLRHFPWGLGNPAFEDGVTKPWRVQGDARVLAAYGETAPAQGSWMGYVGGGSDCATALYAGALDQSFCMPPRTSKLTFNWKLYAADLKEFCPVKPAGVYQEEFGVYMALVNDANDQLFGFKEVFRREAGQLCNAVVESDVSIPFCWAPEFDDGKTWTTDWVTGTIDVSAYAGKTTWVGFACLNGGMTPGDMTVLVDDVRLVEVVTP